MNGTTTPKQEVAKQEAATAEQQMMEAQKKQQEAMIQQQKDMQFETALSKAYAPNTALEMYKAKQVGGMAGNNALGQYSAARGPAFYNYGIISM